ncbi:MAG: winged helix DNA-binding domain-containing protein [Candidatus Dormiibacterota bacterium]
MSQSTTPEVLSSRLTSQLLAGPGAHDPIEVAARLLAVQAQDLRGAMLAVRARSARVTSADIERALTVDRALVVTWLNRGTLHLVRSQDYPWLHQLTAPGLASASSRWLAEQGVAADLAERGIAVITKALAKEGPLTRPQLGERLGAAGLLAQGRGALAVLFLAGQRGLVVRGPMVGGQQAMVLVRDWLAETKPVPRDAALVELARRYLAGHAPATDRDLAQWSGLSLGEARTGLSGLGSILREREDGLLELADQPAAAAMPGPKLLGQFEPLLLGWKSREQILGVHKVVETVNGRFRPFALVEGRAAATWSLRGPQVALQPFAELEGSAAAALEVDAEDVARFFGMPHRPMLGAVTSGAGPQP